MPVTPTPVPPPGPHTPGPPPGPPPAGLRDRARYYWNQARAHRAFKPVAWVAGGLAALIIVSSSWVQARLSFLPVVGNDHKQTTEVSEGQQPGQGQGTGPNVTLDPNTTTTYVTPGSGTPTTVPSGTRVSDLFAAPPHVQAEFIDAANSGALNLNALPIAYQQALPASVIPDLPSDFAQLPFTNDPNTKNPQIPDDPGQPIIVGYGFRNRGPEQSQITRFTDHGEFAQVYIQQHGTPGSPQLVEVRVGGGIFVARHQNENGSVTNTAYRVIETADGNPPRAGTPQYRADFKPGRTYIFALQAEQTGQHRYFAAMPGRHVEFNGTFISEVGSDPGLAPYVNARDGRQTKVNIDAAIDRAAKDRGLPPNHSKIDRTIAG